MKRLCVIVILLLICFIAPVEANKVNKNDEITILKQVEKSYSEKNEEKFKSVVEKATKYANKHYVENAAIVSDVDETVLDNRKYYKIYKVFNEQDWQKWSEQSDAEEFKLTADFIRWAKTKGYKIFFITGRTDATREATIKNLEKCNIPYDRIFFKPDDYNKPSASFFKTSVRKNLTDEGYKIIINIGDQKSDLKGRFGKDFKLPNPIYKIP